MGVKLATIIEKEPISFGALAGKTIAIDFSNFAFQFLSSIRQRDGTPLMDGHGNITSHLVGIWSRFSNLMQREMHLIIVLDGLPPKQKMREIEERHTRKEEARGKYHQAREEEDTELMFHYAKQFSILTPAMIREAVELIGAMGMPVIQAPAEADAQIAYLTKQHDVWAGASSDYDCMLHGAERLITNLTLSQKKKLPSGVIVKTSPELIDLFKVLKQLDITNDQLIYLAMLVGTDYNTGVHGIGPKKALKLVKEYKQPEKIFAAAKADIQWREVYELFTNMPVERKFSLAWKDPGEQKIRDILINKHDFSEERVSATCEKLFKKQKDKQQKGLSEWV